MQARQRKIAIGRYSGPEWLRKGGQGSRPRTVYGHKDLLVTQRWYESKRNAEGPGTQSVRRSEAVLFSRLTGLERVLSDSSALRQLTPGLWTGSSGEIASRQCVIQVETAITRRCSESCYHESGR